MGGISTKGFAQIMFLDAFHEFKENYSATLELARAARSTTHIRHCLIPFCIEKIKGKKYYNVAELRRLLKPIKFIEKGGKKVSLMGYR